MKKLIALALTIVIALSALGCAAQTGGTATEAAKEPETATGAIASDALIGIVLPTKEESRWLNDQKYFEEIFGGGNYNYEILFSQNNSANEKTNIETLLSKGAKIIVLCAYDATAAAAAVSDAKADGAIVISYDRLIMGTDKLDYYVTFDSRSVGKAQADYLIAQAAGRKGINLYM